MRKDQAERLAQRALFPARSTASSMHLRWRWDEEGLQASLVGAWNIAPGDRLVWAEVQYDHFAPHALKLGAVSVRGAGVRWDTNRFVRPADGEIRTSTRERRV